MLVFAAWALLTLNDVFGGWEENSEAARQKDGDVLYLWRRVCKPLGETRRSNCEREVALEESTTCSLPNRRPSDVAMAPRSHGLRDGFLYLLGQSGLQDLVEADHQINMGLIVPTRHFCDENSEEKAESWDEMLPLAVVDGQKYRAMVEVGEEDRKENALLIGT